MNLHRTTGKPDWETTDVTQQNLWQRWAAQTNGLVTLGNILTIVGFGVVVVGLVALLQHHYWAGVIGLVTGRLCDIADGWLAELTGTKSPLGELLDAGLDKLGTILTIVVFFVAGVAPWWIVGALLLPHGIISIITIRALGKNIRLHPSRLGKLSMAVAWISLVGLVLVQATNTTSTSSLGLAVFLLAFVSVGMGLTAAVGYAAEHH